MSNEDRNTLVRFKQNEDSLKHQLQINDDTDRNTLAQFLALQKDTYRKYRAGQNNKIA